MSTSDGQNGGNAGAGSSGPQGSDQKPGDRNPGEQGAASEAPALTIIEAFGGIRPMAKTLGLAVSTVQGWKERAAIPANRHDQIRAAARENNIAVDAEMLRASAAEGAPAQPQVIEGEASKLNEGTTEKPAEKSDRPAASAATAAAARAAAAKTDSGKTDSGKSATGQAGARSRASGFMPGLVIGVVLAAGVATATVLTQPYWGPFLQPAGTAQSDAAALGDLQARLDELQAAMPADDSAALSSLSERLATLEAALSQGGGQDPDTRAAVESLNAQLARMTDRLAALEQDVASARDLAGAPSSEVIDRLGSEAKRLDEMLAQQRELAQRLAAAEADLQATTAAREAAPGSRETLLLLAALQLRDALQGSGPFAEPLDMLKALAEEDAALMPIIEPLERRAPAGLPSLRDLQAAFPEVARRIAAIEVGQEGEGWTAGVLRRVAEAVNLRPVGMVEGDAHTAVAARAEVQLNDGDLAGAVAEIATLDGAAAEAAANWRADAEARLAANRAVSALGALVAQRFSGMAGG